MIEKNINKRIQRDQTWSFVQKKKKKETKTWPFVQKKSQDLATTKQTYERIEIRLRHSHNKSMNIRITKVNQGGCQGVIHRAQA